MNLVKARQDAVDIFKENAKLRGALIEMLTNHGTRTYLDALLYGRECDCHACTNARKLLAGE